MVGVQSTVNGCSQAVSSGEQGTGERTCGFIDMREMERRGSSSWRTSGAAPVAPNFLASGTFPQNQLWERAETPQDSYKRKLFYNTREPSGKCHYLSQDLHKHMKGKKSGVHQDTYSHMSSLANLCLVSWRLAEGSCPSQHWTHSLHVQSLQMLRIWESKWFILAGDRPKHL